MNKAEELLNGIPEDDISLYTADPTSESLIVINSDRTITVPAELKRIAVQYDHDIETVTFQCPRYWDGHDMSEMVVYINYKLPDGSLGSYWANNVTVDESNDHLMYFDWVIYRNVTQYKGNISFLVCIKKVNEEGLETNHWNSELNKDLYISEGLECEVTIVDKYPDVLTQILMKLDAINEVVLSGSEIEIVTISNVSADGNAISSHTYEQMNDAHKKGKIILVLLTSVGTPCMGILPPNPDGESVGNSVKIFDGIYWHDVMFHASGCFVDSNPTTLIYDGLDRSVTGMALSANQGKVLNEKIGDIETALDSIIEMQNELMGVSE